MCGWVCLLASKSHFATYAFYYYNVMYHKEIVGERCLGIEFLNKKNCNDYPLHDLLAQDTWLYLYTRLTFRYLNTLHTFHWGYVSKLFFWLDKHTASKDYFTDNW